MLFVKKVILIFSVFNLTTFFAQENSDDSLSTLKIGNVQGTQTLKKKDLQINTSLLFGKRPEVNIGTFDGSFLNDINVNCNYGLITNLTLGIGISNANSLINGTIKYRFLNQTPSFKTPISMAYYGSMGYTYKSTNDLYSGVIKDFETKEAHRINYLSQLIISIKINQSIYLEVLPSYVYRNFIKESFNVNNGTTDVNGFFSLGVGGKLKLYNNVSFIGNYFYNFANYYRNNLNVFNPMTLGFEATIKRNVLSLYVTNATGLIENNFIPQTSGSWKNGHVKFGFSFSRVFAL
jgi:hypothetical protein